MARPQPPIIKVALRYRPMETGDVVDILGVYDETVPVPEGATQVTQVFLNHPGPYPGIKIKLESE